MRHCHMSNYSNIRFVFHPTAFHCADLKICLHTPKSWLHDWYISEASTIFKGFLSNVVCLCSRVFVLQFIYYSSLSVFLEPRSFYKNISTSFNLFKNMLVCTRITAIYLTIFSDLYRHCSCVFCFYKALHSFPSSAKFVRLVLHLIYLLCAVYFSSFSHIHPSLHLAS